MNNSTPLPPVGGSNGVADMGRTERPKDKRWPKETRQRLRERDGDNCHYCEGEMLFPVPGSAGLDGNPAFASIEHIKPCSSGGSHDDDNLVLAHLKCNRKAAAGKIPLADLLAADARKSKRDMMAEFERQMRPHFDAFDAKVAEILGTRKNEELSDG